MEFLSWILWAVLIFYLGTMIFSEYKRIIGRRRKIKIFVDSMHSTMYISPSKTTTDEEIKRMIDKYSDNYKVKIVSNNVEISGITKYIVDFTQKKKGQ